MSDITKEQIEHIAKLARIKLTDREEEALAKEMGAILDYIGKLKEVNTDNIEPTAQVTGLTSVFRPDEPAPDSVSSGQRELLLSQAPDREGDHVKVRGVFEDKK